MPRRPVEQEPKSDAPASHQIFLKRDKRDNYMQPTFLHEEDWDEETGSCLTLFDRIYSNFCNAVHPVEISVSLDGMENAFQSFCIGCQN